MDNQAGVSVLRTLSRHLSELDKLKEWMRGGVFASEDHEASPQDVLKLQRLETEIESLRRALLHHHDFSNADLAGATLAGVSLRGCNLQGADLRGACLNDADLSEADLSRANFSLLDPEDDLSGADVRDAVLDGVRLDDAILDQANFSSSSLRGARLRRSSLFHTLFIHADLSKAVLEGAQLGWANMRDADLSGATFGWISAFEDEEGIKRQLLDLRVNIDGARFSRVDS